MTTLSTAHSSAVQYTPPLNKTDVSIPVMHYIPKHEHVSKQMSLSDTRATLSVSFVNHFCSLNSFFFYNYTLNIINENSKNLGHRI